MNLKKLSPLDLFIQNLNKTYTIASMTFVQGISAKKIINFCVFDLFKTASDHKGHFIFLTFKTNPLKYLFYVIKGLFK